LSFTQDSFNIKNMQKNKMQDVLPPERRSIRDIPLPRERQRPTEENELPRRMSDVDNVPAVDSLVNPISSEDMSQVEDRHSSRFFLFFSIILGLGALLFAFSTIFAGATVNVTPKTKSIAINDTFTAEKMPGENQVKYNVISVTKNSSRILEAKEEKLVNEKASGKIIIVNNENKDQVLIKNTRFETEEGLIYRIAEQVKVPGKSSSGEGGMLEVTVYADKEGSEFNIGMTDFTIPGFMGDPRHKTIYAKSKTAMTGGHRGIKKIVSPEDEEKAGQEMRKELTSQVIESSRRETPADYVFYDESVNVEFVRELKESGNSIEISEKATGYAFIFDRASLEKSVAERTISSENNYEITVAGLDELSFSRDEESFSGEDPIKFKLAGDATAVWNFDETKVKEALRGKPLSLIEQIISDFNSIDKAEIVMKPFWKRTLPEDLNDIKIVKKIQNKAE